MRSAYYLIVLITSFIISTQNLLFAQATLLVENLQKIYSADEAIIDRLSGAIQYETISSVDDSSFRYNEFKLFHEYLEKAFPLTHQHLNKKVINEFSLLYVWEGTSNTQKPILFSAHMDVVPVEEVSRAEWQESPFSGTVKDGFIWGRGTMDDKYRIMAIMEAVESLLAQGYMPNRTIFFAFGHDEEVGGVAGAGEIASYLASKNITFEAVFDEGLAIADSILPAVAEPIALIGTAAKGNLNIKLTVDGQGGHSSVPPSDTPINILSTAIHNLHTQPFKPRMTATTLETVKGIAELMGGKYQFALNHYGLFKGRILKLLAQDQATDALIRTKMSPTIIQAGDKYNVLPRQAYAIINIRILNGEDKLSVIEHIRKAINDKRVKLEVYGEYSPPSAISKTDSWSYNALTKSIQETFDDIKVIPALFPGTTDSRHYAALTENTFRFAPQVVNRQSARLIHNVDERMSLDVYLKCIEFYQTLFKNTCSSEYTKYVFENN